MDLERIKTVVKWLIGAGYANNQKEVGELLGYTNESSFSQILNGKKTLPNTFVDRLLAIDGNLSKEWLIEGKGEMLKSDTPKYNEAKMIDPNFTEVIKIPVKAKAGYLHGYNDEAFLREMPVVLVQVDQTFHGKYRCFEVEGDSMNDGTLKSICDGDTVLCREVKRDLWCYKLHYSQWMFVINHVDGLLIKQIVDHDVEKGTITCHSLNPIYGEDFILNLNEVRELYNVIKITDRNLKL